MTNSPPQSINLFLAGDVMTGRGIDQILPHPGNPCIYESYMKSALDYWQLAQSVSGPITRPASFHYIWGELLGEVCHSDVHARIINLETSITDSEYYWAGKSVHYRMHPANIPCLTSACIDCCTIANNHLLDWGYEGLYDSMNHLEKAGIAYAGAGMNIDVASQAAVLPIHDRRLLVVAFAAVDCGAPTAWAASHRRPGIHLLSDLSFSTVKALAEIVDGTRRPGDLVVASIHWGGNWGYGIPPQHRSFARALITSAQVDLVWGHSSHHVKGLEIYQDKLILYGCGDLVNDYEGITGHDRYRGDLGLMYFPKLDPGNGKLQYLRMIPTTMQKFQLKRATRPDAQWLITCLSRESILPDGNEFRLEEDHTIVLKGL